MAVGIPKLALAGVGGGILALTYAVASEVFDRATGLLAAGFVLVSPLLDDAPLEMLQQWSGFGQARTVLSPDIVAANTVSGQFDQVRRRTRLARAQTGGARAIDWRRGTPLQTILDAVFAVEAHSAGAGVRAGGGN